MECLKQKSCNADEFSCRFKFTKGINDCELIEDYSQSNQLSDLELALKVLCRENVGKERIVILSDLTHGDETEKRVYEHLLLVLQEKKVDRVIGVGEEISKYGKEFTTSQKSFYTKAEDLLSGIYATFSNAVILINNASDQGIRRITNALQQNTEHATINVNLDAIKYNLDFFRKKLNKTTKIMAVVKAATYGAGEYELANIMQHQGVDYFAVAYAIEGIWFRTHGIMTPILIFNPAIETFDKIVHYNLEPTIYSLAMLLELNKFIEQQDKSVNIHIKLETGMNRHGFNADQIDDLITAIPKLSPKVIVKGIYSHLCGQDDYQHHGFCVTQADKFIAMSTRLENELELNAMKHLVATGGTIHFPEYHFDMVRLGSGIFGLGAFPDVVSQLIEAMTLTTIVSQVIKVTKGSTIGYDRTYVAPDDIDVAIIDIGYTDGFRRSLGNGAGNVWIGTRSAKTVGRICMDMTMIDVTGLDVNVGDIVTIFGESPSVDVLAKEAEVFRLEVLTNMHHRVRRVLYAKSPDCLQIE